MPLALVLWIVCTSNSLSQHDYYSLPLYLQKDQNYFHNQVSGIFKYTRSYLNLKFKFRVNSFLQLFVQVFSSQVSTRRNQIFQVFLYQVVSSLLPSLINTCLRWTETYTLVLVLRFAFYLHGWFMYLGEGVVVSRPSISRLNG